MKPKVITGIILALLFTSMLNLAFNIQPAKASGTIYIRADGSVDPPTAPISTVDNITYTFIDNIYDGIVVEKDNITIDGAGYTLQTSHISLETIIGLDLSQRSNVTMTNMEIRTHQYGIRLYSSTSNIISNNKIVIIPSEEGIRIGYGIHLEYSYNNTISRNRIIDISRSNNEFGIYLERAGASNNVISYNELNCSRSGIYIEGGTANTISGNNITNSGRGINIFTSNNDILYNNINNCDDGIGILGGGNNRISYNNVTSNSYGIRVDVCSDNEIYHNNFIDNSVQAYSYHSANAWDNGYPSGGNYWSDYRGVDEESGSKQDQPGSDGIGDTPYDVFSEGPSAKDRYPFVNPWLAISPTPDFSISASPNSLTIQQGDSDTSVIIIMSTGGFNQPVQLTVSGAPSGVSATFNPEQVTPPPDDSTTSTLTVSVDTTATPGSYILNVKGTNDSSTHSVGISLEITTRARAVEAFPLWILGAIAGIAVIGIALGAFFLRRRNLSKARI